MNSFKDCACLIAEEEEMKGGGDERRGEGGEGSEMKRGMK
jgi:hypothetical protein